MLTFSLIIFPFLTYSQTTGIENNFQVAAGAGLYGSGDYFGISLYSSLNWGISKSITTVNGPRIRNSNLETRVVLSFASIDENHYQNPIEFGFLYGTTFGKTLQMKIAGGLGIMTGRTTVLKTNPSGPPSYVDQPFLTPAIPLELGLSLSSSDNFGIGLTGFANLNTRNSMGGATLTLEFGKRNKLKGNHVKEQDISQKYPEVTQFVPDYKTSIGIVIGSTGSYGISIKRFTVPNRAIEGTLSSRKIYDLYVYGITVLFEKEHKIGSGLSWFWGDGFHAGYGSRKLWNGYFTIKEKHVSIGPDVVFGLEYNFANSPINVSTEIHTGIDLILYPWIAGSVSMRYAF